uniref:Reverse transcriptase domain-containing protein n=1 Tax=Cajanus cajan TaxID=3821 RepID=A0A151TVC3_CAJCA|nr:hypothetical protein KK1_010185 [Cajanus cajan]
MLRRLGFNNLWVSWISECLMSSRVSVLVNGSPSEEFGPKKGLRQGDPLSPFLFIVVAEGLTGMMREAVSQNSFGGVKIGSQQVPVSIIQYADDTMFIGEANLQNVISHGQRSHIEETD